MKKVIGWILVILGLYEVLALMMENLPGVLEGANAMWGWIVGIIVLVLGLWLALTK